MLIATVGSLLNIESRYILAGCFFTVFSSLSPKCFLLTSELPTVVWERYKASHPGSSLHMPCRIITLILDDAKR